MRYPYGLSSKLVAYVVIYSAISSGTLGGLLIVFVPGFCIEVIGNMLSTVRGPNGSAHDARVVVVVDRCARGSTLFGSKNLSKGTLFSLNFNSAFLTNLNESSSNALRLIAE